MLKDNRLLFQPGDVFPAIAQFQQNFLGVLADFGRGAFDGGGVVGELDRAGHHRHMPIRVVQIDKEIVLMQGKIAGKVTRTHLNLENGLFEVGIRFLHPSENNRKELEELLKKN